MKDIRELLLFMKPRLKRYLFSIFLDGLITAVCFNIVISFVCKFVLDAVETNNYHNLALATGLSAAAFIIGIIIQPLARHASYACVAYMMADLRKKIFQHLANISMPEYEKTHSGDLLSRAINDLSNIEKVYLQNFTLLAFAIVQGILSLFFIFKLEWRLGLAVLIIGAATILIDRKYSVKAKKMAAESQQRLGGLNMDLTDIIRGLHVSKIFNMSDTLNQKFKNKNDEYSRVLIKKETLKAGFLLITETVFNQSLIILVIGIILILSRISSIGTVFAAVLLQGNAGYLFSNLNEFLLDIQSSISSALRINDLFNLEAETDAGLKIVESECSIDYENVSFEYHAGTKSLSNLNIHMEKLQKTALVGYSGSGKSTAVKLLLRFYPVQDGRISMNGKNISDYSLSSYRNLICYVPQNSYLFHATVAENIRYGRYDATMREITDAAKKAGAHDFISALPQGYDTIIDLGGSNLSGGQKQRICIARAIIKNAPVIILDEATASVDAIYEKEIFKTVFKISENKTLLSVTHKLDKAKYYDHIAVLKDGTLAESGNHETLMQKNGLYQVLFSNSQNNLP